MNLKNEDYNSHYVGFITRDIIWKLYVRYEDGLIISKEKICNGLFMLLFLGPKSYAKKIPWLPFTAKIWQKEGVIDMYT